MNIDNSSYCVASSPTAVEALATSSLISIVFVACLYLLPCNRGDRDIPSVVRNRLLSLSVFAAICEGYVRFRTPAAVLEPGANPVLGVIVGVFLTALLYAGHLLALSRHDIADYRADWTRNPIWLPIRDYAMAPLLEELVFRRHSLLLWRCLPLPARITGPAALFSLAHLHHARRGQLAACVAQLAYTFVFGTYAATLYSLSKSLAPAIAAHIFCNLLGLPNIPAILGHKRKNVILYTYFAAIVLAFVSLVPLSTIIAPP